MSKPTVLVSGSSGGIGTATCRYFHQSGYEVVGIDLHPAGPDAPPMQTLLVDVTDADAVALALGQAGVDEVAHVITLAGISHPAEPVAHLQHTVVEPGVFRASIDVNLIGHYNVIYAALPRMERCAGDRSITVVSSINAIRGFGLPAYSAAKAGLLGLVTAMTPVLGQRGIRINALMPGTTPTPATIAEWAQDPGHFEKMAESVPLGRLGTPENVAEALGALVRLSHVTGQHLAVDGGQSVWARVP